MSYIRFEDGVVSIDGTELPGLLRDLSISGQVKFDEAKTDGQSGTKRTPMGYEDATVSVTLELITDDDDALNSTTCYDKLETINGVFKSVGPKAAPKIVTVTNRHIRARGINQMVFSGLSSQEGNADDVIIAALNFVEHLPPVTKTEQRVVGNTLKEQKQAAAKKTAGKEAAPTANVNEKSLVINTN